MRAHGVVMPCIQIRVLGRRPYAETHRDMKACIETLKGSDRAELWLVEHDAVFTQGQAGKAEHLLHPGEIPVIQSDRGGQVTYHGPGQIVLYTLVPLKAFGLNVRQLVTLLEESVLACLSGLGIQGELRPDAPGVYVQGAKIASLGLRIRHGVSYHGVALNAAMDLEPFTRINPCGYEGLPVTQVANLVATTMDVDRLSATLAAEVERRLQHSASSMHGVASQSQ